MILLVVGILEFDSGKTSIAASLTREARSRGIKAIAFKPIGAHNAWGQYETLIRSLEMKLLVGEDAYRLWIASGRSEPIELISPLDIMSAPPILEAFRKTSEYLSVMGSLLKLAVIARITKLRNNVSFPRHYLIVDNLSRTCTILKEMILNFAKMVKAERIKSRDLIPLTASSLIIIEDIVKYLLSRYELLIIESFNNIACPCPSSLKADYVIAVAPGHTHIYSGKDYSEVLKRTLHGKLLEVTTGEVIDHLNSLTSIEILPRSKEKIDMPGRDTRELLRIILTK